MYKKDTHLRAVVDGGAGAGVNHLGGLGRGLASALVDACVHKHNISYYIMQQRREC